MQSEHKMALFSKHILKKFRQLLLKLFNRTLIQVVKILIKKSGIKIALINNTSSKIDGVGAQLQRLIAIVALCNYLKIPFIQQEFNDVSVHPLDPFQDHESKKRFLKKLNTLFKFQGNTIENKDIFDVIEISYLSSFQLLKIILKGVKLKKTIVVKVIEPYKITNQYQNICSNLNNYFPNWVAFVKNFEKNVNSDVIYIHYRQGVGGLVVYPGQKIPREMSLDYYLNKINDIRLTVPNLKEVFIFTDAPQKDLEYVPESYQKSHWEGTPGFNSGKLYIKGNNLESGFSSKGLKVQTVSGGDPLEAIAIMSLASYLITSRSSLSYLAGLLNASGRIYYANEFWHPKPSSWY